MDFTTTEMLGFRPICYLEVDKASVFQLHDFGVGRKIDIFFIDSREYRSSSNKDLVKSVIGKDGVYYFTTSYITSPLIVR